MDNTDIVKNYSTARLTLTNANTEYSQALSERLTRITVSSDDLSSQILFSFTLGASGTGKRIFQGAEWTSPGYIIGSQTLYAQSPNAGAVVVIESWEGS